MLRLPWSPQTAVSEVGTQMQQALQASTAAVDSIETAHHQGILNHLRHQHLVASGVRDTFRDALLSDSGNRPMLILSKAWGFKLDSDEVDDEDDNVGNRDHGSRDERRSDDEEDHIKSEDSKKGDTVANVKTKSQVSGAAQRKEKRRGQKRGAEVNDEELTPTPKRRRE